MCAHALEDLKFRLLFYCVLRSVIFLGLVVCLYVSVAPLFGIV